MMIVAWLTRGVHARQGVAAAGEGDAGRGPQHGGRGRRHLVGALRLVRCAGDLLHSQRAIGGFTHGSIEPQTKLGHSARRRYSFATLSSFTSLPQYFHRFLSVAAPPASVSCSSPKRVVWNRAMTAWRIRSLRLVDEEWTHQWCQISRSCWRYALGERGWERGDTVREKRPLSPLSSCIPRRAPHRRIRPGRWLP